METSSLLLDAGTAAAIDAHGSTTYPHECCGALLGTAGRHRDVRAAQHDRGRTAPPVSGPPVRLPHGGTGSEPAGGCELLGFYHSHPDHPARPSQYDLDHAWPFFSYVIVSVMSGSAADDDVVAPARDRSAFDEEP